VGISVVTPPASEPITVAEAKGHCRIDTDIQDGELAGFIFAAREFVEGDIHHKLVTQTLDLTIDDDWPHACTSRGYLPRIHFPVKPIASVTSISYVDTNGATQTLALNQYTVRTDVPAPYIEPAYGVSWPAVRCQGAAITVRFVAGWAAESVPNQILQAIRLLIAHADSNREAVSSSGTFTTIPLGVEAFLSPYRWPRFS
jgi:uncharacterized phiE125 gp8 family phage protein